MPAEALELSMANDGLPSIAEMAADSSKIVISLTFNVSSDGEHSFESSFPPMPHDYGTKQVLAYRQLVEGDDPDSDLPQPAEGRYSVYFNPDEGIVWELLPEDAHGMANYNYFEAADAVLGQWFALHWILLQITLYDHWRKGSHLRRDMMELFGRVFAFWTRKDPGFKLAPPQRVNILVPELAHEDEPLGRDGAFMLIGAPEKTLLGIRTVTNPYAEAINQAILEDANRVLREDIRDIVSRGVWDFHTQAGYARVEDAEAHNPQLLNFPDPSFTEGELIWLSGTKP